MEQIFFARLRLGHDSLAEHVESCVGVLHGQEDFGMVEVCAQTVKDGPLAH